jgi:hypothetical protein
MFVELVHGRATDPLELRKAWEQALAVVGDVGVGWLGATSGVGASGAFVAMLGFESEESARITMDRLDARGAWDRSASHIADRTFRECPQVRAFALRDLRHTDLVQVTQGYANDIARVRSEFEKASRGGTADETVIGGFLCCDGAGFAASALYRSTPGLGSEIRPDALAQAAADLFTRPVRIDLTDPWSVLTVGRPADQPRRRDGSNDDRPVGA